MLKYENEKGELERKYRHDLETIRTNFEERTKLKSVLAPACRHPHNEIMVITVHGTNEISTITCTLCGKKNP